MPQLNFVKQGKGPVLVLSHSLGSDLGMWDEVAAALEARYTVLRYDHRGHGKSEVVPGPYTMAALAEDVASLIAEQAKKPVHFIGLSMGGMVAQALAVRYPQMIRSIVVANSANYFDEARRASWRERIETVRKEGLQAISGQTMQRWFTREFRADTINGGAQRVERIRATLEATDPQAYIACCEAILGMDFRTSNGLIHCPSLVIYGKRDESTPEDMSRAISLAISGAQLHAMNTAHLSATEKPMSFAKLVSDFLEAVQ